MDVINNNSRDKVGFCKRRDENSVSKKMKNKFKASRKKVIKSKLWEENRGRRGGGNKKQIIGSCRENKVTASECRLQVAGEK